MSTLAVRSAALWRVPLLRHVVLGLVGLTVMLFVLGSLSPFRDAQLATMAYLAIAAGGLTVLTGFSGQLSLGHGAFLAVGAYTTAVLLEDGDPPFPLVGVMVAAVVVTVAVGAVVGIAAARLHGPYVAGATLALAVAVPSLARYLDGLGQEQGLHVRVPDVPTWFDDTVWMITGADVDPTSYVAYLGWTALVVTYVLLANLMRSRVGRTWRALSNDDVAAEIAGVRLGRARVLAFVVSTAAAGLAGSLMAMAVRVTSPSGFSVDLSVTLLSAIVLGGLGTLSGALIGSALLTFLPQAVTSWGTSAGLSDVRAAELAPVAYGLIMIAVVLLAPAGIVGSLRRVWWRRRGIA
ncbi:branched-chain amino acid transport system permease protein [Nocardioides terrae]|uniref:Branched-chain amino acid transport system permease protein n=1 Tax=Nocardioides terrae TaxID=574651 RepID=A0A1I1LH73_9ACTN|nr:branched-chain amino acid ABC transporter permease [Nocardioides terrae]SFC72306.1 branched-chain amino acid transport system permease protein [Nocardioides terrae]